MVSIEGMKSEKYIIKQVHEKFRPEYKVSAIKKNGLVNNNQINKLMENAIKKVPMSPQQEEIVQGFYDMYMGALSMGGSDMAEGFAQKIFK